MLKIKKVAIFDQSSNRMKTIADVETAIKEFKNKENKNLDFLLKNRFSWMKKFISSKDKGLEVGAGAGFSKNYIKNKNFVISDFAMHDHLDLKNIDAQDTNLNPGSYDFVIAVNMLHHVPYPLKFLKEMYKILKPGGKLIIQEAHPSIVFQIVTMIMRHEGFDFTKDVWNEKIAMSKEDAFFSITMSKNAPNICRFTELLKTSEIAFNKNMYIFTMFAVLDQRHRRKEKNDFY